MRLLLNDVLVGLGAIIVWECSCWLHLYVASWRQRCSVCGQRIRRWDRCRTDDGWYHATCYLTREATR